MPRYSESDAREAIGSSFSYAEALRKLGLRPAGGNHRLFRRYVDELWGIPTDHFDRRRARRGISSGISLEAVLVEHSTYSRSTLKRRLFEAGVKARESELCGQGEMWRGARMALILDHINGISDDNRLENLRVACPNCAATFDTHCGRKNRVDADDIPCMLCGAMFRPSRPGQKYCSRRCGTRHPNRRRGERPSAHKVPHPARAVLVREVGLLGFSAVGRKYGVTGNAVRKWIRCYDQAGGDTLREEAA